MPTAQADLDRLTAALDRAGAAGLTQNQVYSTVFAGHRSAKEVAGLLGQLESSGRAEGHRLQPAGGNDRRPTVIWRINPPTTRNSTEGNGSAPPTEAGPPDGEGWLPLAQVRNRARRGVMPAYAARIGKRMRTEARASSRKRKKIVVRVDDEHRGARQLAYRAFYGYRRSGVIEVRDGWVRLARNPDRRPPHHWHEALLHILAEAHPTLDGKWHPKPKRTVRLVKEAALGRVLEPDEYARRKPGKAGSWEPADIDVITKLRPDTWTAEGVRRLAERLDEREHR